MDYVNGSALFVNYFTAHRALIHRGGAEPGERVLVHGASGGVGIAAVQWCGFLGLEVWGTAGSPAGLELVQQQGAAGVADHGIPEYEKSLAAAGGFDLILEMRGDLNLHTDLDLVKPGGRIMIIGSRGETTVNPRKTMTKECDIRGVILSGNNAEEIRRTRRDVEKAAASGDIAPVIAGTYTFEEVSAAHRDLMSKPAGGKRVLLCE
jgi:NADPH2:quinone reductase